MQTTLTDTLFWIAIVQWVTAFPVGRMVSDYVPRIFSIPIQMILVSIVMLVVICAVFVLPLLLTGNFPLPCCERIYSYKYGAGVGIGLLIIVKIIKRIKEKAE